MPGKSLLESTPSHRTAQDRSGTITLWTILFLPVLIVLLLIVVEGIHFWLARVELENALEATALAAVKEWAESGNPPAQNWTQSGRFAGLDYGNANTIRGINFNPSNFAIESNLGTFSNPGNPNENATCTTDGVVNLPADREGTLIFGAIIEHAPLAFDTREVPGCGGIIEHAPLTFDTREVPGCGGIAELQLEVTSNGLEGNNDNAWGISYPATQDNIDNDLLISKVVINLDPNDQNQLRFDFISDGLRLSDNNSQPFVKGPAPDNTNAIVTSAQHDSFGFIGWFNTTSPSNPFPSPPDGAWPGGQYSSPQVVFTPTTGNPEVLTMEFFPLTVGLVTDDGFEVGDRLRFGTDVERAVGNPNNPNWATADGDDIGDYGVQITVYFINRLGNPVPSDGSGTTSTYVNTEFSSNQCAAPNDPGIWVQDGLTNYHLLVHPSRNMISPGVNPFDLPCPLTSAANNDKQSIAGVSGGGAGQNFAVRAQARIEVPLLCGGFCGITYGPYQIFACSTAMYDCELSRPRLIRPEIYICTGATP